MSGLFTVSMNRPSGRSTASHRNVHSYDGMGSSILSGTVSESELNFSTVSTSSVALAAERWSIEKRRQEWDTEMQLFRHREEQRMKHIQLKSGYYCVYVTYTHNHDVILSYPSTLHRPSSFEVT